jgi:hypothetical protein
MAGKSERLVMNAISTCRGTVYPWQRDPVGHMNTKAIRAAANSLAA